MTDRRSPAWRLLILIIGAIALSGLVAAAACNDDDGGADGSGDPAAPMDDFDGGEGDDGTGDGGGDSLADLAAFGGASDSYTGEVPYALTNFNPSATARPPWAPPATPPATGTGSARWRWPSEPRAPTVCWWNSTPTQMWPNATDLNLSPLKPSAT